MKRIFALLLVLVISVCLFSACGEDNPAEEKETENYGKIIYVSVDGNDANAGTKESPLATINGAVKMITDIKASSGLPDGGIKVELSSGRYRVTETVDFTEANSGEDGKPIVFAEAKGATVIFDGGVQLKNSDFKPVTDEKYLSLLPTDEARKNTLCIDLSGYDIDEAGADSVFYGSCNHYLKQVLSANGTSQTLARWPNGEYSWSDIADNEGEYSCFKITEEQAARWSQSPTMGWNGYGNRDWQCTIIPEGVIADSENNVFKVPNDQVSYAPCASDMPFYIFNTPCELDVPGEYYRDMENNVLYYWPIDNIDSLDIVIGSLNAPAFNLGGGKNIIFDGMDFQNFPKGIFRGTADGLYIYNSVFSSCYEQAIFIEGFDITIDGCEMFDIAAGGIDIVSGDWTRQEVGNVVITNNILHNTSWFEINHHAPLKLGGWGIYVAHNKIYDTTHHAIEDRYGCGNTIIEYNEFYHISYLTADSGVIHIGRNWVNRKYTVRYNYFHDIYGELFESNPAVVYFDDMSSGDECYSNLIVNAGGNAIQLCGGRYYNVYNNVIVNCDGKGITMDGRGFGWNRGHLQYDKPNSAGTVGTIWNYVLDYYQTDIWRYCMPEILCGHESAIYYESTSNNKYYEPHGMDCVGTPAYSRVYGNIGYNLNIKDPIYTRDDYPADHNFDEYEEYTVGGVASINGWGYQFNQIENNLLYSDDIESVFVDPANGNFFLKDDSRVYRDIIGFEKWDYSLIGPQK